ncbi:triacylglycerol lipase [Naasia sp. SYSU D00948]|uniref:esterase/lipase family protein n=1 Tax=Naasia sp. SYSU D00948 TaxID=2817379 RepID=UPI001B30B84C|nr:alpha/beta hydrolase [Naasia sp. SYSU D00948]
MRLLANGWFWLLDYLYVAVKQVQAFVVRVDPATYRSPAALGRPVLLIPGIYETWQFMRPVAELLRDRGHPIHVVTGLGWNTSTIRDSADLVAAYLEEADLRGVTLVAHSKGGLIGKYTMLRRDPEGRIDRMVAIATPFSGSIYARYALTRSIRDFSPADTTLRMLGEHLDVNRRITSIEPSFDPHIPGGSRLDGAVNVRLRAAGHFRIFGTAELLREVERAVDGTPEHALDGVPEPRVERAPGAQE